MWYFLHKTINLITGDYYYGIHQSFDMYFGRKGEGSWDPHLGTGKRIQQSLEEYGRHNFVVESVFCHTDKELVNKKFRDLDVNYNDPKCMNGLIWTPTRNKKISESLKGYKQTEEHKAKTHKTHNNRMWINNGKEDKYVSKDIPIPEGWKEGRMFRSRNKSKKK